VPSQWMLDGDWEKDATKPDVSCMKKEAFRETSEAERKILRISVERAKAIDARIDDPGVGLGVKIGQY